MSLASISLPPFNTVANCAISIWAIEGVFRTALKSKFIVLFSDSSTTGRAIHQCLDISQYLLGTALLLSRATSWSVSRKIAASVLLLPVPLFCKAICQKVSKGSTIYRIADSTVQVMRVGINFAFVLAAMKDLLLTEPGMAQLLGAVQITGVIMVSLLDATNTINYLITSHLIASKRDFYLHLRWSL